MDPEKLIHKNKAIETLETLPDEDTISDICGIFKALSDPSRLKIVLSLLEQEHCVRDIAMICAHSESAVSHQLRILRALKIVKNRREGKIIYYSLDDSHVRSLIRMSLDHVKH